MSNDFFNFILLNQVLTWMCALIGNLNFGLQMEEFETLLTSALTITNATLGNFDIKTFDQIVDPQKRQYGQLFMLCAIVFLNMMLLNFIVAILANTYNLFDLRSNGLYLSEILNTRDDLIYDDNYGSFLSSVPPINIIQIPFIPLAMILKRDDPWLLLMNSFLMQVQYFILMSIIFAAFLVVSLVLIPFAWVRGIYDKIQQKNTNYNRTDQVFNLLFIPFGPFILLLDLIADVIYFWKNSFRTDLKMNIIPQNISQLSHKSLRNIENHFNKMKSNSIKSVANDYYIRHCRNHL